MNQAPYYVNMLLSLLIALTYTWVLLKKGRGHDYAGNAQFWRFLGLWSLVVCTTVGVTRSLYIHRPVTYVTWMFTIALIINAFAVILTVREIVRGISQVDDP